MQFLRVFRPFLQRSLTDHSSTSRDCWTYHSLDKTCDFLSPWKYKFYECSFYDSVVLLSKLTELWINCTTELEKLLPFEFFFRDIYYRYIKSGSFLANFGYFGYFARVRSSRMISADPVLSNKLMHLVFMKFHM